ncbi:glutathione S-transferase/chloride channel [Pochonia chlamydosporia 170]|uniref:Glutathione S-transferase/chloride channel n=1 Tax=Pochonia chlamydosporia 170 TaxID=1380566 RepID=A0A179FL64_METCM|nr:glutathione S-transferase/chloride channel [Pochonia chlamydosporia 170]OAQ65951.1 glutathione S-transferase/chloride channel [Pochonia chlamydosporia 170]
MSLTVHHLGISQSERIPFLCEELGIDYNLKLYKRAPKLAPPEYKALHPQGTAPIIQDGDITLAESGACIEYISHKFGNGKLFIKPSDPAYADFIYWWHWANGTLQPTVARVMMTRVAGLSEDHWIVALGVNRLNAALAELDKRVAGNTWLAGEEFSAADVMIMFTLTTMRYWSPYSLGGYDGILGYVERVSKRDGYQRAMKKADPEMELVLGADAPKGIA